MDPVTRVRFEVRARIINAMAHPTRLFIVDRLSRGERCVRDLTAEIGADMSTVSRHLSILKDAGIIQDEKRGSNVYYRLRVPCVMNFFNCVETILQADADDRVFVAGSR